MTAARALSPGMAACRALTDAKAEQARDQVTRIATDLLPFLVGPIADQDNPLSAPPKRSHNATFLRYLLGWLMHNSLGARRGRIHECFGVGYDRSFTRDANRRIEDARMDDDWDESLGAVSDWISEAERLGPDAIAWLREGERIRQLLAGPVVVPIRPEAWYESPIAMMFRRAGAAMNRRGEARPSAMMQGAGL